MPDAAVQESVGHQLPGQEIAAADGPQRKDAGQEMCIRDSGTTVLLVEQNASRALGLADRGYVMESGEITMDGEAKALLNDPKVRAAYLGE